jgi:hypothetical protein
MKKEGTILEKLNALKDLFQNHQILVSIVGFILFILLGHTIYNAYLEQYITGYKNNIKRYIVLRRMGYNRFNK